MELASPYPEEPVTQIEAGVPVEPLSLQAENADLELDLQSYERPLAVFPNMSLIGAIHVDLWTIVLPEKLPTKNSSKRLSQPMSHTEISTHKKLSL